MSVFQVQEEAFTIPLEDDLVLRGNVHSPEGEENTPVILISHGFKGYKDWNFFPYVANQLAENGFTAIRFNFSLNGVSGGDEFDELEKFAINTYSREQADLAVLLEHVKDRKLPFSNQFDLERIGLVGHSRGGGNSIIFASEYPEIKAIASWNGVAYVDFFGEELKKEVREKGVGYTLNARTKQNMPIKADVFDDMEKNKERFDILAKLKTLSAPVHIIQGDADMEYLVNGAKEMEQTAAQHTLAIIPDGDHTFNAVHPLPEVPEQLRQAMEETLSFLKRTMN